MALGEMTTQLTNEQAELDQKDAKTRVLVCAGGTGGGIYPALAAANALFERGLPREQLLWVGVSGEMEEKLIPREGIELARIVGGPIAGVPRLTQLKNSFKLLQGVQLSLRIISRFRPDVVLLTGGYMALPVATAARLRGIPAVMYLPDLEPGSSLRIISRFVDRIAATFRDSAIYFDAKAGQKIVETGYPVRAALIEAAQMSQAEARAHFSLREDLPVLFVFGGSRGAWSINQALMDMLPELLPICQIIHISGTLTWEKVSAHADSLPDQLRQHYRPFPYLHDDMGIAFRAADLVVARAGASMLGESLSLGSPLSLSPTHTRGATKKLTPIISLNAKRRFASMTKRWKPIFYRCYADSSKIKTGLKACSRRQPGYIDPARPIGSPN